MPIIDDCIESIGDATIFMTLDPNEAIFKSRLTIPIEKKRHSRPTMDYTDSSECSLDEIMTPGRLKDLSTSFLSTSKWKYALMYLNDIVVFYESV